MNTPLHLFIGCSPIAHKPHASENRTESSKKNTMQRVATENFAKTCNILKKRRNVSLCELAEKPFFTVEKSRIVRINEMRAMGFEIRPFYAFPVPFPAPSIFQTCNNFNRIYIPSHRQYPRRWQKETATGCADIGTPRTA